MRNIAILNRIQPPPILRMRRMLTSLLRQRLKIWKSKQKIFKQLDDIAPPHAIFASNTSSLPITEIAAVTNRPEKVIGMHFMNPVPVMKLMKSFAVWQLPMRHIRL